MAKTIVLSAPPFQVPLAGSNGLISDAWQKWIYQAYLRMGGIAALSNVGLTNVETTQPIVSALVSPTTATMFTSPAGLSTVIDSFYVTNNDVIDHTISIYLVAFGAQPSSSNAVISGLSILSGVATPIPSAIGQVLGSGSSIVCTVDKANAISLSVKGRQVS